MRMRLPPPRLPSPWRFAPVPPPNPWGRESLASLVLSHGFGAGRQA